MRFPSKEFIQVIGTRLGFGVLRLEPDSGVGVVCPLDDAPADVCKKTAVAPENPNWLAAKAMTGFEKLREEVFPENSDVEVGALLAQLSKSAAQHEPECPAVETRPLSHGTIVAGFPPKDRLKLEAAFGSHTGVGAIEFLPWSAILAGPPHRLVVAYVPSTRVANHEREMLRTLLEEGRQLVVVGSRVAMQELGFPWPPPAGKSNLEFIPTPWTGSELAACLERMLGASQVLARPAAAAPDAVPVRPSPPPPLPNGNGVRRIVIADTDPIARALVESSLAIPGAVECEAVADGEAAFRLMEETRPDVLVMEIALPNRDGFQLLAEIKRSAALRSTRVIVLTTRTAEVDVLRAFGLGADDYVTKPFSPLELRARVKRLLAPGGEADPA